MASPPVPPPLVIGNSGSLTNLNIQPPAEAPSPGSDSGGSEFSTPPTSPRVEDSPDSPRSSGSQDAPESPTSPRAADLPDPPTIPRAGDSPDLPTSPRAADSPDPLTSPRSVDSPVPPTPEQAPATLPHLQTAAPLPLPYDAPPTPLVPDDPVSTPPRAMTASPPLLTDDSIYTPPLTRTAYPPLLSDHSVSPPPLHDDDDTVTTPPLVRTVSPPLPPVKLSQPAQPPPVQVPPPQYETAAESAWRDRSVVTFFWDAVARVQEAHATLDEYISNWFGLDQSKYQWALDNYHERTGQVMDSVKGGNQKELVSKMDNV